jgi:AraC-like DNA-binding protein
VGVSLAALRNPGVEPGFDVMHADLLCLFPDLVRNLGGDPQAIMRRVGVEPGVALQEKPGLTYRSWVTLLEHAAGELDCPDFGMRLARLQGGEKVFGPISMAMQNSRTFGDALEYAANHLAAHSLAAGMRLVRETGRVFVSHEILLDGLPNKRQAIEQVMLLGHLMASEMTGGHARAREVRFRHQPLSSRATYRSFFGAPVRFDEQEDGLVFSDQDLRCAVVARDVQLYELATTFIDTRFGRVTPPMHAQVRALVVRLIETGDCSIEHVCDELGLHPRTLHRRLRAEGTSFDGIKDDVRRDIALRYLQETDHPLTFIAEKLGYAEQSVLTRSCMRWFSACPSQLRTRTPTCRRQESLTAG